MYEFNLIFPEEDIVNKITTKWMEIVPKLCQIGNLSDIPTHDQEVYFAALKILDSRLKRSGGPGMKHSSVFSVFEVS